MSEEFDGLFGINIGKALLNDFKMINLIDVPTEFLSKLSIELERQMPLNFRMEDKLEDSL